MKKKIRNFLGQRIMRRVDLVRHELRYRPAAIWSRWKAERKKNHQREKLAKWFEDLGTNPPDVLIGANIGGADGIIHHISAIRNFSRLNVQLSPPDWLMNDITHHDLHTTFRDEVMGFEPNGIRVLHSHVFPYFIQWCRRHRDSVALWVHTYHLQYYPLDPGVSLEDWQGEFNRVLLEDARHADVRISVSKWQQRELLEQHGIETIHLPNGVNVAHCDLGKAQRFRDRHGDEPSVLYVGRNDPVKNPGEFVRLAQRMPETRFIMIGRGLDALQLKANWNVDSPPNVVFLGGQSHIEVQDALAAAAAVVVTSKREGLPTLVLEAMAHSRPVVVSSEPGSVEAVDEGKFGAIYTLGNLADLEEKLRTALQGPKDIPAARQHVLETYDWRVVAPKLDAIYSGHR